MCHRRLFLVRPWHHPSLLQPFHPCQHQVSTVVLRLSGNEPFSSFAKGLLLFFDWPLFFVPPLKIWVWFCHLHRLGRSLPDCSGGWHAGSVLPKREVYPQIPHVQTPQQQRVRVNWTLILRLIEHFNIPASHIFWKGVSEEQFLYIVFSECSYVCYCYILRNALLK